MKTKSYNPSELEVRFANAISNLKHEIETHIDGNRIIEIDNRIKEDNPLLLFWLEDQDGDKHEMVIKIIQRPDQDKE